MIEGQETIFFDFSYGFSKLGLDEFDEDFLWEVIFRKAKRVKTVSRVFSKELVADAERLNSLARPCFNKIHAL